MLRRNEDAIKKLKKELREKRKTHYKGFLVIACYDNYGDTYYTMVNLKTQNHVHARTLPLAVQICDLGHHMYLNPYHQMKDYKRDIQVRASKLAFREVKRYN